jgi:hypothetical protein
VCELSLSVFGFIVKKLEKAKIQPNKTQPSSYSQRSQVNEISNNEIREVVR